MFAIRNWRDTTPRVGHESAIIFQIFSKKGVPGMSYEEAPIEDMGGITLHLMQAGKSGDYHSHEDREQTYYFTSGRGKMKIDDQLHDVRDGDGVHIPRNVRHQLINDSDDWVEHLIINGPSTAD